MNAGRARPLRLAALLLLSCLVPAGAAAKGAAATPVGLWISRNDFGPAVRGVLTVELDGTHGRAAIAGRSAPFEVQADSVQFRMPERGGWFRGRLAPSGELRGFWVQPADGIYEQQFATPLTLVRVRPGRWRGTVVPVEPRITMFLQVSRDSGGVLRAAFRNPELNLQGGAPRFRLDVLGDTLRFTARPDTTRPEVRREATWDRARRRVRMHWPDVDSSITFVPCPPADAARLRARESRGRTAAYHAPPALDDGWATARARDAGLDEALLARFVRAIADTDAMAPRAPLVHACLIERHGRLVFEEYFFGHDRDQPHDLRSAGKTFASVLLGAAMRSGAAIAPESSVVALMRRAAPFANPDPRKDRITVAQLLTHTSGLACDDNDDDSPGSEGRMQIQKAMPDWWRYTLDLPMAHDPGSHYAYCSGGMNLVGGAISAATGRWLPEVFDSLLARPLGFGRYHYNLMPSGDGYLGGGAWLRPRDLLKLGRTFLDRGTWRGRTIVDSVWVRRSMSNQAGEAGVDGYAWHLAPIACGGRTYLEYEANGNGGQFLIVLPELDMSIVFTAGNYMRYNVWGRFRDVIVPQYVISGLRDLPHEPVATPK